MSPSKKSFEKAELSEGNTGKVSDVNIKVKSDANGPKDIYVAKPQDNPHEKHDHYFRKSSGSWGKTKTDRTGGKS